MSVINGLVYFYRRSKNIIYQQICYVKSISCFTNFFFDLHSLTTSNGKYKYTTSKIAILHRSMQSNTVIRKLEASERIGRRKIAHLVTTATDSNYSNTRNLIACLWYISLLLETLFIWRIQRNKQKLEIFPHTNTHRNYLHI